MKEGLEFVSALLGLATALVSMIAIRRTKVAAAPTVAPTPVYQPGPPPTPGPATFSFDTFLRPDAPPPYAPSGPPFAPPPSTPRQSQAVVLSPLWAALRDAGLIFFASAVLGFLVGLADAEVSLATIGMLNIVCLLVGFTIVAVRAGRRRWPHLALVALATWVFSLVNVILGISEITAWFWAAVLILVCAALSGGVAALIGRRSS